MRLSQHLTMLSISNRAFDFRTAKVTVLICAVTFVLCQSIATAQGISSETKASQEQNSAQEFTSLFDGKTLDGWEGSEKWFRVENGAIVAGSLKEAIPNNEFLTTTGRYENFELRLSAKLIGEGDNAGVQFRSERIPNDHEVIGYQCDIGHNEERPIWGSLYDESRRRKFLSHPDAELVRNALRADDWNDFVIRCENKRIQIWLNDKQLVDYVEAEEGISQTGIIALQIHGGKPAEAWYKNIRIRKIGNDS